VCESGGDAGAEMELKQICVCVFVAQSLCLCLFSYRNIIQMIQLAVTTTDKSQKFIEYKIAAYIRKTFKSLDSFGSPLGTAFMWKFVKHFVAHGDEKYTPFKDVLLTIKLHEELNKCDIRVPFSNRDTPYDVSAAIQTLSNPAGQVGTYPPDTE
jgi:hypothetical protein